MSEAMKAILSGLEQAILAEVDGYHFYMMAAAGTSDEKGREVFTQLAKEEVDHANFLKAQRASLEASGRIDPDAKLTRRADLSGEHPIFSDSLLTRAKDAHFERSALSIGTQLEMNAIRFYKQQAEAADDPEVVKFFTELADWEVGHYNALNRELIYLRDERWEAGGFTPS